MPALSASSPVIQQLIAFLEALALGGLLAAAYDLYRAVRMQFRRLPAAFSVIADCFFWIAAAIVTIIFMVHRRWGEIHAYTYGGLIGGFIVYFYFISNLLLPLWLKGFGFLFKAWPCRNATAGGPAAGLQNKEVGFNGKCRNFPLIRRR